MHSKPVPPSNVSPSYKSVIKENIEALGADKNDCKSLQQIREEGEIKCFTFDLH
jgi:hypothetical protein